MSSGICLGGPSVMTLGFAIFRQKDTPKRDWARMWSAPGPLPTGKPLSALFSSWDRYKNEIK